MSEAQINHCPLSDSESECLINYTNTEMWDKLSLAVMPKFGSIIYLECRTEALSRIRAAPI